MEGHRNRRVIEVNDEEWHRTRRALEERLKLPPRIWKVVQLLISGITDNPELSKRLSVTPGSLSQYLGQLYEALEVHSKTDALWKLTRLAAEQGIALGTDRQPLVSPPAELGEAAFLEIDAYLDSPGQRYWPKRRDLEEDRLYWPQDYIGEIEEKLLEKPRCLLTGVSGSGKTVLAVAFGLSWQMKHPEAAVLYLEAPPGSDETMGRAWHREVCQYDDRNALFLVDNCHLAPAAVNAFCHQLERWQAEGTLVLMISAREVGGSPWEDEPKDYFEVFKHTESVVTVRPEHIYMGVLRAYSDSCCRTAPGRFVPVEEDFEDPVRASLLEALCAHNLGAARSVLEAWEDRGGRLSDVTDEAVLEYLSRRYLTRRKAPALVPLCALGQLEIPAHEAFVRGLPHESVAALERENLLQPLYSGSHGQRYRTVFHAQVAGQIFRAAVRRQVGRESGTRIAGETYLNLRSYLLSQPDNFLEVYRRLHEQGARRLQHRLLLDSQVRSATVQQLAGRPLDHIAWYIDTMYTVCRERGTRSSWEQEVVKALDLGELASSLRQASAYSLNWVFRLYRAAARERAKFLLEALSPDLLAEKIRHQDPRTAERWFRWMKQVGCSAAFCADVANGLDMSLLHARTQKTSLQSLYWLLRQLKAVAPEAKERLLRQLTPAGVAELLGDREARVQDLQHFYGVCSPRFANEFASQLSLQEVVAIFARSSLREIGAFVEHRYHRYREPYSVFARHHLSRRLAVEGIDEIGKFLTRLQRVPNEGNRLGADVLELLLATDLTVRVAEQDVAAFALLLVNAGGLDPRYVERLLTAVAPSKALEEALTHSGIRGIGLLLDSLSETAPTYLPRIGQSLTTADLRARMAEAEAVDLGHFLWNVYAHLGPELARTYCRTADAVYGPDQLAKSDLDGLGLFLWNLVTISDLDGFRTLSQPGLHQRLMEDFEFQPGPCCRLLGIIAVGLPRVAGDLELGSLDFEGGQEKLANWLVELVERHHPYIFALTVKGLQTLRPGVGERMARQVLVRASLVDEAMALLSGARDVAGPPRSTNVLDECIALLQQSADP